MLNRLRFWRERGWTTISAADYAATWQRYGGSVATHPEVVARLAELAGIPVRYLGWAGAEGWQAAVPCWGRELALSRAVLKKRRQRRPDIALSPDNQSSRMLPNPDDTELSCSLKYGALSF